MDRLRNTARRPPKNSGNISHLKDICLNPTAALSFAAKDPRQSASSLRYFAERTTRFIPRSCSDQSRTYRKNRIFAEIVTLHTFASYCDSSGLRIRGDSEEFRRKHLDPARVMDEFILQRQIWPSFEYFEIMALAQHYGLPTRLLDWTRRSHAAAYFAASGALRSNGHKSDRLAVWALDPENIQLDLRNVRMIAIPGSDNANIAAQSGLFTLLTQRYARGKPFEGPHCLDEYVAACGSQDLAKITVPHRKPQK